MHWLCKLGLHKWDEPVTGTDITQHHITVSKGRKCERCNLIQVFEMSQTETLDAFKQAQDRVIKAEKGSMSDKDFGMNVLGLSADQAELMVSYLIDEKPVSIGGGYHKRIIYRKVPDFSKEE